MLGRIANRACQCSAIEQVRRMSINMRSTSFCGIVIPRIATVCAIERPAIGIKRAIHLHRDSVGVRYDNVVVINARAAIYPVQRRGVVSVVELVVVNLVGPTATTIMKSSSCSVRAQAVVAKEFIVASANLASSGDVCATIEPVVLQEQEVRPAKTG
jgi:hypothetical protein